MGRRAKTGKDRLDRYYHLAKEQGYRARSAFKLIQLAQKFSIFKNCQVLVDLCAAPGGWLQVAKRNMGVSSKIIGVDLVAIKGIPGVTTFKCDITTDRCRKLIFGELDGTAVDVVLHDGAPNVGTSWDKDAYMQNELVLHSAELACEILRPNGIFVTKVFRSADYNSLLWVLSQLFNSVKATKPQSSRNVSAEIFLVCLGYKAPKKIDPRFFDPRHVFSSNSGGNSNLGLLSEGMSSLENEYCEGSDVEDQSLNRKTKKSIRSNLSELLKGIGKRNRDGYEKGDDFRVISVYEYFNSENPALLLLKSNTINMSPSGIEEKNTIEKEYLDHVLGHPKTTQEIKLLCEDLKVLGKKDLMQLLKWRFLVLRDIKKLKASTNVRSTESLIEPSSDISDSMVEDSVEHDSDTNQELLNMLEEQRRRNKILEKKRRAQQNKREWRASLSKGGFDFDGNEQDLFKYTQEIAQALEEEDRNVPIEGYFPEEGKNIDSLLVGGDTDISIKKSGHALNNTLQMHFGSDDELDHKDILGIDLDIQDYIRRVNSGKGDSKSFGDQGKSLGTKKETRRKKVISDWAEEMTQFSSKIEEENQRILEKKVQDQVNSSSEDEVEANCVDGESYKDEIKKDFVANRWFSNSAFQDFMQDSEIKELSESEIPQIPLSEKKLKKSMNKKEKMKNEKDDNKNEIEFVPNNNILHAETDFENQLSDCSDKKSDSDSEPFEPISKPKNEEDLKMIQGIGSLLVKKSTRMDLIDGSYNRYAFHDPTEDPENCILGLPYWFVDDENKHNKPELPITRELMAQYRAKLREIKNRPIRKESEALARKKRRYERIMERARKKAQSIADSQELNETSKSKAINNLIKKAQKVTSKKRTNVYTVTRRHGLSKQVKSKGKDQSVKSSSVRTKYVDKRLKKDKRAIKNINKKKNARRRRR